MHVNSVVLLCVAKCGVKGLALMNGTAKRCKKKRDTAFPLLYTLAIFILL